MEERTIMADKPHYQTGAADRAHGTHGKGDAREERLDDAVVEPGNSGKAQSAADPGRTPTLTMRTSATLPGETPRRGAR